LHPQANGTHEFYFNAAADSALDLAHCAFLGAFLARALLDGSAARRVARLGHVTLGGVRLCEAFYCVLLGAPLALPHVAHVCAAEHAALRYIHDHDVTPALCLGCFEHCIFAPGAPAGAPPAARLPLKPGGAFVPATNANKAEFVLLKARSILVTSVAKQLDAACAGFFSLVPPAALRASGITPRQLRRLLCGGGDGFDVAALRLLARYERPYSASHPVVAWLWEVLAEEGQAAQSDFLEFVTGASCPPAGGFRALRGGAPPLTVALQHSGADAAGGTHARLPSAHTCSSMLELPLYESKAQLRDKLMQAVAAKNVYCFG
jgi:hypothetical protein